MFEGTGAMSAFSSKRGIYIDRYIYIYHNLKTDLKITYITTKDSIFLYKIQQFVHLYSVVVRTIRKELKKSLSAFS